MISKRRRWSKKIDNSSNFLKIITLFDDDDEIIPIFVFCEIRGGMYILFLELSYTDFL